MKRGEIWWLHRPNRKPRPVCVLTRDEAVAVLARVLVAAATTTQRGIPTEVGLDEADGMPRSCVLSLDNVLQAPKGALTDRITMLSPARMNEVCDALAIATDCSTASGSA